LDGKEKIKRKGFKYLIKFSKNIIRSFKDLPDKTSLIIHSLGCNFKCYQCFNYEALVHNPLDICNEEFILDQIKLNGFLADAIIFSGGEFLLNSLDDIISFLVKVKNIFNGIIIINTNGTSPDKIQKLSKYDYVHGFHTDMKLPYHLLNEEDSELILGTIGKELSINDINNILKSIEYTIKYDQGHSQIRSVKYTFLHPSAFIENQKYIDLLNSKYNKQTKYYINEFIEGDEIL
jgi:pyruvate formate lyase activating enzyme